MGTIAFVGQKGGTGKTTTAICVAAESLARGRRVLLVDADPQGTTRTWGEIAAEEGHPCPSVVAMGAVLHHPNQLPTLAEGYDLVVIDCPPRHGEIQRSALMVADLAVMPCGPSGVDAWAMAESLDLVREAQVVRPNLQAVLLVTRKTRTVLGANARSALAEAGVPILATELGFRVAYQEAPPAGLGVTTYAPNDQAAVEVRALVDELEDLLGMERANRGAA